jgi:hypothetical protein
MKIIAKLKNIAKAPTCITFKSTTRLPKDHRFNDLQQKIADSMMPTTSLST